MINVDFDQNFFRGFEELVFAANQFGGSRMPFWTGLRFCEAVLGCSGKLQ